MSKDMERELSKIERAFKNILETTGWKFVRESNETGELYITYQKNGCFITIMDGYLDEWELL